MRIECEYATQCIFEFFREANIATYMSAIIFNLYNWTYYIIKINEYMNSTTKYWAATHYKLCFTLLQLINFIIFIIFITARCATSSEHFHLLDGAIRVIKVLIYMIAAIAYLMVAYHLYNKLYEMSLAKANMMRNRLILSI